MSRVWAEGQWRGEGDAGGGWWWGCGEVGGGEEEEEKIIHIKDMCVFWDLSGHQPFPMKPRRERERQRQTQRETQTETDRQTDKDRVRENVNGERQTYLLKVNISEE